MIDGDGQRQCFRVHGGIRQIRRTEGLHAKTAGNQIDRPVDALQQPYSRGVLDCAWRLHGRADASPGVIDRGQPIDALGFGQRRKRNEMHHDAGGKPHREQQAKRDAQPAMNQDQDAHAALDITT